MSVSDSPFWDIMIPVWKTALKQTNNQNLDKLFLRVLENGGTVRIPLK